MNLVETYINIRPSQIGAQKTVPASRPSKIEAHNTAAAEEEIRCTYKDRMIHITKLN